MNIETHLRKTPKTGPEKAYKHLGIKEIFDIGMRKNRLRSNT